VQPARVSSPEVVWTWPAMAWTGEGRHLVQDLTRQTHKQSRCRVAGHRSLLEPRTAPLWEGLSLPGEGDLLKSEGEKRGCIEAMLRPGSHEEQPIENHTWTRKRGIVERSFQRQSRLALALDIGATLCCCTTRPPCECCPTVTWTIPQLAQLCSHSRRGAVMADPRSVCTREGMAPSITPPRVR